MGNIFKMRGRSSRPSLVVCSYLFGVITCSLIFYLLICNGHMGQKKPKRQNHRIYLHNQFYNSKGLLNEGPGDNADAPDDFDDIDHCVDLWHKYHKKPLEFDFKETETTKSSDNATTKLFINCGGTFPWSVELFLDTYPRSEEFKIHSFIKDWSYGVMYKHFANHTLHISEASSKNRTVNRDVKCFGCGYTNTEKAEKLDIAEWIQKNTKKTDYVIVRVESEEEKEIVKRLVELELFKNIDKYYTTSTDPEFVKYIENELSTRSVYTVVQSWDISKQTYSDFITVNPKSIPVKGKFVDKCLDTTSTEKFALFLYSVQSTPNVFKVINMLHQFSPKNVVQTTAFLPYKFFNTNWGTHIFDKLFKTLQAGMYFSDKPHLHNDSTTLQRNRELSLRNTAIAVQKVFQAHSSYMQNIMYSNEVSKDTLQKPMDEYNYIFLAPGIDITHLIGHVLNNGTVTMDMTGWTEGKYLMINIDVKHSEYLVLYMLRRFAPWLLNIFQCSLPMPARA